VSAAFSISLRGVEKDGEMVKENSMNDPIMPTLEPLLIPEGAKKRRKPKSKSPAVVISNPEPRESSETPETEETGTWLDDVDDCQRNTAVQNLLQTARGSSLILWSLCEKESQDCDWSSIVSGLQAALKVAADDVDATYFASAGELADTLSPKILAALLKKKLKRVEAKMAEEGE
jgi:hypothetical protein